MKRDDAGLHCWQPDGILDSASTEARASWGERGGSLWLWRTGSHGTLSAHLSTHSALRGPLLIGETVSVPWSFQSGGEKHDIDKSEVSVGGTVTLASAYQHSPSGHSFFGQFFEFSKTTNS